MRPLAALAAVGAIVGAASVARADRREASVHVHALGGLLSLGDAASTDAGSGAFGGLAARASYATANSYQYDAQLTLGYGRASFDRGDFMLGGSTAVEAPFTVAAQAARLDGGVTLRLGVQWIPTVRVAVGVQGVRHASPVVTFGGLEYSGEAETGQAASLALNLVGSATLGLDYRVNRRLIVGAAAAATASVPGVGEPWREAGVTVHAAYYWYPRW
ncbi:MAG: hypothetical protein IPJ61_21225 [Tessaracoccus sp.]|uniref:hypothetical protein n=1 Tax=Tessaracoccus sp. TaxID=1971211 RepID=UPI001ED330D4|nr:hypothetical protein [Tessaracoccus sp.]MBK7823511.1 hypothetical protein [Tessaracoccus sp.]